MASEENQVQDGPVGSEAPKNPGVEDQKESPRDELNPTHGDSGPHDATHDQTTESKPTEEAKLAEQDSGPNTANTQESPAEDKQEESKTGDKREHESTEAPLDTDKSVADDTNAHQVKKQKTSEEAAKVENGAPAAEGKASASETNGEKKKPGRPKRTKDPAKRAAIPTDGIGSRTRSRTKAA